jgi:hypothetical protein
VNAETAFGDLLGGNASVVGENSVPTSHAKVAFLE